MIIINNNDNKGIAAVFYRGCCGQGGRTLLKLAGMGATRAGLPHASA